MKNYLFIIITALSLILSISCTPPMTNDEIINEVKKCKDAGLNTQIIYNTNFEIRKIQCIPKGE